MQICIYIYMYNHKYTNIHIYICTHAHSIYYNIVYYSIVQYGVVQYIMIWYSSCVARVCLWALVVGPFLVGSCFLWRLFYTWYVLGLYWGPDWEAQRKTLEVSEIPRVQDFWKIWLVVVRSERTHEA